MPRPKANTEKKEIFLPPEALEQLKEEAEEKGMSTSGLIRMIILDYLKNK